MRERPGNCALCGIWRRVLCRDHIVPKHKGGSNDAANIQFICANCHQDKTAVELSAFHSGRTRSPEECAAVSRGLMGRVISDETKARIRESVLRAFTPELRARLKVAAIARGERMRGTKRPPHSPETRAKISAALKARFSQ